MLYRLEPQPYKATKTEMQALGYPNPHAFSYILHPIRERLHTFHLDLAPLLREVNHQGNNTYGTPLYLAGIQLRRFMPPVHEKRATVPVASATGIYPSPHELPTMVAETQRPYRPSRQGSSWTPEEDTLLLTHLKQHTPIVEIAPHLQRSEKAIVRRMGRLRSMNTIPFALYIHYYNNDPAFTSSKRFGH